MKTRTKRAAPAKASEDIDSKTSTIQKLEPSVSNPPQVFILPKDSSAEVRIVTFPNPATPTSSRYFVCPEIGWYEFTRVAAPKRACRSWLLAPDREGSSNGAEKSHKADNEGYVLQSPDLMVATPIDPLFLLLPVLLQDGEQGNGGKLMFLTLSDYLDRLEEKSDHFKAVMRDDSQRRLEAVFETRARAVCDVVEAGDETLYRVSQPKLLTELVEKAKRMVRNGLPASMEERFVKRELAVPVLSIKREESSVSFSGTDGLTSGGAESEVASQAMSQDTQSSSTTADSVSTAATSITSVSTPAVDTSTAPDEVINLLRLRTALNFILASYIPPPLRTSLESLLANSPNLIDFTPLNKHLSHINDLKKEAQALRSISDNISRKRGADEDDDEALEKAEAKKRKKEEEEFKKKNMSRGVQQLAKADTSGMKKLSSFFTKGPAKKKS